MFLILTHLAKITNIRGFIRLSLNYNEEILKLVENNINWE